MFNRINLDHYTALTPRLRFADGDAGSAGDATGATGATASTDATTGTATAATGATTAAENVADLPAWAQKIISDTRTEAAGHRTAAKTAADDASKALTDKLAIALGLKPDAATDPAALTASLTASQAAATQAARELAIYKSAGNLANPAALLDSTSFLASVSGIDPTDGPAITAAITAAVAANPNLKAARAAGASSVETPGGTGEAGQITEAQLAQMTAEQIVDAQTKGLLKNLF